MFTKFNQHKLIKKSDKSRCRTGFAQSSVEYDAENEETLNNCVIVMKSPVTCLHMLRTKRRLRKDVVEI